MCPTLLSKNIWSMKILFISIVMLFLNFITYGQGFKKNIIIDKGNAIFSSTIYNDSLFILGVSNDFVNGWHGNFITMDSLGKWEIITKLYRGNVNNFSSAGKSSRLLNFDTVQNQFYGVIHDAGYNDIFMFKLGEKGNLLWSKIFSYPINNLGVFTYGIIKLKDDYLIYGDIQLLNENVRGFVLKVDEDGNQVYWNLFGQGRNWHEYYGALSMSDSTFITYGQVLNNSGHGTVYDPIWYSVYDASSGKEVNRFYDTLGYKNYNLIKDPFSDGYIGFGPRPNDERTAIFAHVVWYDEHFDELRKTPFGIKDPNGWKHQSYEYPYHSTMDAEGNLYAATTGYIPHFDPSRPPEEVSEVLTVTKINPLGEIVWESIDTVFLDEVNGYAYVDNVTGINVSSSGSVYVVGTINAIIPPDTTYRGNGWIVKYDKHGCIIENCRMVSTIDTYADATIFSLYPNPVQDVLNVSYSYPSSSTRIDVYDIMGTKIFDLPVNDYITSIDIAWLPAGFYVVSLFDQKTKVSSKKFIKN